MLSLIDLCIDVYWKYKKYSLNDQVKCFYNHILLKYSKKTIKITDLYDMADCIANFGPEDILYVLQHDDLPDGALEKETETEKIDFAVVFLSILSNIMKTYDIKNINYSVLNIKEIQKKIKNKFKIDINFIEKSIIYLIQNNVIGLQGDVIYIKNRFPEYYNLIQNFKIDTIEVLEMECIDYKKSFRILK